MNNCSTCSNAYIHYNVVKIYKGIFTHMQPAICNLNLKVVHFRGTKHFIIKLRMNIGKINAFNHWQNNWIIINCLNFYLFALTYRKLSTIFKKPARSTPVSFDRWDRRLQAKLPRSNKTTGRVTKGQAVQPTYASLANEVVHGIFTCNPAPTFTALKMYER